MLEHQDPSTIEWQNLEFEELHKHAQSLGLSMSSHPSLKFLKKIVGRWHKRHEQEMKEQLEKETQERIQEEQRIEQLKEQEKEWRENWRKEHAAAVAAAAAPAAASFAQKDWENMKLTQLKTYATDTLNISNFQNISYS